MQPQNEIRRLSAIMFTDMVGYSALTQRDEALALSLLTEHNDLIRTQLALHQGKEIKTVGDAFLVEFSNALDAVRCSIAIQNAFHLRNTAVAGETIQLRIGIHLGDVVYRDADVFGDGVNIASRIHSVAEAGGICVSEDVARQVQNKLDKPLIDLGIQALKNIQLPIHLYGVQLPWLKQLSRRSESVVAGTRLRVARWLSGAGVALVLIIVGWWIWQRPAVVPANTVAIANAKSIAVLPFTNFGGNKEDEYFGDGITEDLLTQLAQITGLKVISRTSIMQYKGTTKTMRVIGRELGVSHILEGSVRRIGSRFRINAQLIDAERDEHLWAKTYDRDIKDILVVQSEVTREISDSLKVKLQATENAYLSRRAAGNPEAYVAYLQGMHILRPRIVLTMTEYEKSVPYFERVIALDPDSPLGYVGLAKFNLFQAQLGLSSTENYAKAEKLVLRAIALDAESADAYIVLAAIKGQGQWSWKEAEQASTRAIQLNPGNATAWDTYRQNVLQPLARVEEAIVAQKRAIALDPVNANLIWRLATLYLGQGQCDEAMRIARQAIEIDPSFTISHTVLVDCLEQLGRFEEAIAANRMVKGYWVNDALLDDAAAAYKRDGSSGYYRVLYAAEKRLTTTRNDAFMFTAGLAMQLGERDEAFKLLNQAIDARDRNIFTLKTFHKFASVHDDPRYLAALKRLNLN